MLQKEKRNKAVVRIRDGKRTGRWMVYESRDSEILIAGVWKSVIGCDIGGGIEKCLWS